MAFIVKKQDGYYALAGLGFVNSEIDVAKRFEEGGLKYTKNPKTMPIVGETDSYSIGYNTGELIVVNVADIFPDAYHQKAALCYGFGKDEKSVDSELIRILRASGVMIGIPDILASSPIPIPLVMVAGLEAYFDDYTSATKSKEMKYSRIRASQN